MRWSGVPTSHAYRRGRSPAGKRWIDRAAAVAFVVLLHSALLALLLLQPASRPAEQDTPPAFVSLTAGVAGVTASAVHSAGQPAAAPASPPPPPPDSRADSPPPVSPTGEAPPLPPVEVKLSPLQVPNVQITAAPAAVRATTPSSQLALQPGAAGGCDLEQRVQDRLASDPAVRSALQRMPEDAKSVANAVQLWNGGWIAPSGPGVPDLLTPARTAILETIGAARPGCRTETVVGPRLILVAIGDDTYIITLGSGSWRWADLLAPIGQSPSKQ